jgi:hypothetical protein
VPFHVGGHKPKPPRRTFRFPIKHRFFVIVIGASLIAEGSYKFTHGRFVGMNYLHQPVYTPTMIGMGIVFVFCAFIPASWVDRKSLK